MDERITQEQFTASEGVGEWRVRGDAAHARFRTGAFSTGVRFIDAISELADAADHHPDVELTYPSVTLHLTTHDVGGLSQRDVELARQISEAARELDIPADPHDPSVGDDLAVGG